MELELKAGQIVEAVDGTKYEIEEGDILQESIKFPSAKNIELYLNIVAKDSEEHDVASLLSHKNESHLKDIPKGLLNKVIDEINNVESMRESTMDYRESSSLQESAWRIDTLSKAIDSTWLNIYGSTNDAPNYVVRKANGSLEIEIGPDRINGKSLDYDELDEAMELVADITKYGGFKTGYGSWILRSDYRHNDLVSNNID